MVYGFLLLILSGFFQGSFGLGYKKYPPFTWAAFWGIYSILCMLIPYFAAFVFGCGASISNTMIPFICGALWGLSAIGFSKAISKIGMSLVYGISMGISTVTGSLIPILINGAFDSSKILPLIIGYCLTLLGVAVITFAGIKRDGAIHKSGLGIILAVLSGLGSGAMNIGFNFVYVSGAQSYLAESAVRWLPVLLGGGFMSVIWCIGELCVRHEWDCLVKKGNVRRTAILTVVSVIWYSALLIYGVSVNMLGSNFSSIGWVVFNALALIVSTFWGIITGEWKSHSKKLLYIGCILLITAWIFIGGI